MKQLSSVSYPKDFTDPEAVVVEDEYTNKMVKMLEMERGHFVATGDTLVMLTALGYVEVYKLVASCEVEVPW